MIQAVLFDVDDTLYDQLSPFAAACRSLPALDGLALPALYEARSRRGMEALQRMNAGEITLEENHIYRMQAACRDLGLDLSVSDALAFQAAYEAEQVRISITAGMTQILELCRRRGWVLGVITNGPSDHQRRKCQILGLNRWIPDGHIFISGDCGRLKPDPYLFQLAQSQLRLDPDTTVYVGDSYIHDMAGAMAAGWQCFWLNRRRTALPAGVPQPDGVGLEPELLDFLRR